MADLTLQSSLRERARPAGPVGVGGAKLAAGGAAFLLLTVGVFWYQFHRLDAGYATPQWAELRWRFSTVYLAATAGFVCLARALGEDAGDLLRPGRRPS